MRRNIGFPFRPIGVRWSGVKFRRASIRYLCSILLICCGVAGILFSPAVGVFSGTELRSFMLNDVQEYSWGSVIATTQFELPFIKDQRGFFFMNMFLAASLGAIFSGVHWFTVIRRKELVSAG